MAGQRLEVAELLRLCISLIRYPDKVNRKLMLHKPRREVGEGIPLLDASLLSGAASENRFPPIEHLIPGRLRDPSERWRLLQPSFLHDMQVDAYDRHD